MNTNKLGMILALGSALGLAANTALAQGSGYLGAPVAGAVAKSGFGLCWRASFWTPAMATMECDPDLVPKKAAAPAPAPRAETPPPPPAAKPAPPPTSPTKPAPAMEKVTLASAATFDVNKATLKDDGKAKLDDVVNKLKGANLETVVIVGYTDSSGSDAYNKKLSLQRADAVKAYLVGKGVAASRIRTEGKGESQPIADNKTKDGRAKNRRVEITVTGTRK